MKHNIGTDRQDALQVPERRVLRSSKSLQRIASTCKKVRDASPIRLGPQIKHRVSAIKSTLSAKSSLATLNPTDTPSVPAVRAPPPDIHDVNVRPLVHAEGSISGGGLCKNDTPAAPTQGPSWFALPAEIREQIYTYAFSGKTIHIHREWLIDNEPSELVDMAIYEDDNAQPYSVGYTLCCAEHTDSAAHVKTILVPERDDRKGDEHGDDEREATKRYEDEHDVFVPHWQDRHTNCRRTNPHRQLDLPVALLRTCRQIHLEAAHMLYCDSTFCFQSSTDMDFFVRRVLTSRTRKDVRAVRVHAEHVFISAPFESLKQTTVNTLSGLRFIGLTVGYYKMTGHKPDLPVFTNTLEKAEIVIGPKKPLTTMNTAFRNRGLAEQMERQLISTKRTEPFEVEDDSDRSPTSTKISLRIPRAIGVGVPFNTVAAIRRTEQERLSG